MENKTFNYIPKNRECNNHIVNEKGEKAAC